MLNSLVSFTKTLLDIPGAFRTQDPDKRLLGPKGREKIQPEACQTAYDFNHEIMIVYDTGGEEETV